VQKNNTKFYRIFSTAHLHRAWYWHSNFVRCLSVYHTLVLLKQKALLSQRTTAQCGTLVRKACT